MITKFKLFETLNEGEPEVGDWIVANKKDITDSEFENFVNKSIGYIFKKPTANFYLVKYFDIPKNVDKHFTYSDYSNGLNIGNAILLSTKEIIFWSKDRKDLEHIEQSKKFNI